MKTVIEHIFNGQTTGSTTDYTKTYLGTQMIQKTGNTALDNYISAFPLAIARPYEATVAIAGAFPFTINWSSQIDWVFLAENSTAAVNRRIILYEYDKIQSIFSWKGYITFPFVAATTGLIKGFRMDYVAYTGGTASANGTSVSGIGTTWTTDRLASGARIGFGSIDPTQIVTWYEISSIDSDTSITLSTPAPVITNGSYVIEELRVIAATSNTTTTNGGLYLVKGLNYSTFSSAGVTISLATNVDNIRACYWLADASTVTMIAPWGLALDTKADYQNHDAYCIAGTTSASGYKFYKYNIRAALTVSGGKTTSAFLYTTGVIASALVGSLSVYNNGRIITLNHGAGAGVKSIYWVTTTRIYRSPLSTIINGGVGYVADSMVEIPPGGVSTFALSTFSSVEGADSIDRLVITCGTAGRAYVTRYNTVSSPFDLIFLSNDIQYDQSIADTNAPIHPTTNATIMSVYTENGIMYLCRNGSNALTNQMYAIPMASHRTFADATGNYVTTPSLNTNGAIKYYRAYINSTKQMGDSTFGAPTEDFDLLYRTTGISDNSGSWTFLDYSGDLSGVAGSNEIQFKIRFKTLGTFCIPSRIYSISVTYEDSNTDSHYTPSVNKSNVTSRIFAYRQSVTWSGTIPNLRIRLYNASTGSNVLDDTVDVSGSGTWQYSTDGISWNTWSSSADNVGNYIRYIATTLPDAIIVRALLTQ